MPSRRCRSFPQTSGNVGDPFTSDSEIPWTMVFSKRSRYRRAPDAVREASRKRIRGPGQLVPVVRVLLVVAGVTP